uniref:Uncharacterized protein n=1 Tax=Anguilla anguilla TaxID=7936 RepID=A0A0E9P9K8_ANGAN
MVEANSYVRHTYTYRTN